LMEALGINIPTNCMTVNRYVNPGQGEVDIEENYVNCEYSEEYNNNNTGSEQYQGLLIDTAMLEYQEGSEFSSKSEEFELETRSNERTCLDKTTTLLKDVLDNQLTSEDSQMNEKRKRKICAQDNDPGKKFKIKDRDERAESIQAIDDVIFDNDVVDEGKAAKTEEDIKLMMEDAAELLKECTAEYVIQPSYIPKIPQSRSVSNVPPVDKDTAVPSRKLSAKSCEYENEDCEELILVTGTSEFDIVDHRRTVDARKAMVNNIQYLLKEKIKSDTGDDDTQLNTNTVVDAVLPNESVQCINQCKDYEKHKVNTDTSDEVNSLDIVTDQLIPCQISEAQSDELLSSNFEDVDEVVTIRATRKRKVDAGSDKPVCGEAVVLSRLRRNCRGVCPLCNKEYSTKILNSHAARCKGVN